MTRYEDEICKERRITVFLLTAIFGLSIAQPTPSNTKQSSGEHPNPVPHTISSHHTIIGTPAVAVSPAHAATFITTTPLTNARPTSSLPKAQCKGTETRP
ncbi:hypothetical protein CONLIGDRAFT_143243 [Coniochaeta ligniaria NRRL 30616]|uniref:Uncharacterized protein n=1 Tax=Coniochaeta ligniaria NRRL 30616 TaxID=1408157 RepID=A0A1J7J6M0_9PEZI|nr:hypothetical protein CONLIGDRAFT_143243 [Coniochaeta ligniaria NRRL 30616]